MPADVPREQLASIVAVADNLDRILDQLFKTAAELKDILSKAEPGPTGKKAAE
jgi:hypothetical protein